MQHTTLKDTILLSGTRRSLKKLFVTVTLIVASLCAIGTQVQASEADSLALKQARNRMLTAANLLQSRSFSYDGVTPFSMAFINRGSYSSISTPLQAGVSYTILGVGDDDACDVDVIIQDSEGNMVAQDVDSSATAVASFTPRYGDKYTIFLKLHSGSQSFSACALSIFRRSGGYRLANDSVRRTTDSMFEASQELQKRFGTIYHSGTGQWAIVGSILQSGSSSTFSGVSTLAGAGVYAFVAVGDEDMRDLDMKVRDAHGNLLLQDTDDLYDTDDSRVAVCAVSFESRQTCSLELINARSAEYSLVLHAALHN